MKTNIIPEIWKTYEREDLRMAYKMIDLGFGVEYSGIDIQHKRFELPNGGISFIKGDLVIWKVKKWIVANLIDGRYCNHLNYDTLQNFIDFHCIKIRCIETNKIMLWDLTSVLEEINRDRSDAWTDYDKTDWVEGWEEWIEGEFYSRNDLNGNLLK